MSAWQRIPAQVSSHTGIAAGWRRKRWRRHCPVHPLGRAWRTYASGAPRPHARRRHRPRPGSSY
eukprot:195611-Prymnesium_polylepis.1